MAWAPSEDPLKQRLEIVAVLRGKSPIRGKAVCPNLAFSTEKTNFAAPFLHQSY